MKKQSLAATIVVCVLLLVGSLFAAQWFLSQANDRVVDRDGQITAEVDEESNGPKRLDQPSVETSLGVAVEDMVEVGGIKRPKRDVAFEDTASKMVDSEKSALPHPGNAPAAGKDANPQVKQLFEELSKDIAKRNPAAVSALFAPEKFDAKVFEQDTDKWLSQVRPGRAFQPAQPGPDIDPIKSNTGSFQRVVQGEKVVLEVVAKPGAPVTFYTPQVGTFPNELTTQSVQANEKGIAQTTYTATAGTMGLIDIVAASPVNSGLLKYKIHVSLPQ